jgi:hypothetical protein
MLTARVEALGYMHLNVFEIVFAKLDAQDPEWTTYFEDSIARCSVLRDELDRYINIYNPKLTEAYKEWKRKNKDAIPDPVSKRAWIADIYKSKNKA